MKNYKNEKESERVISDCNTILNEHKIIEGLAKTDKTNFAEFTLKKKPSESKIHKKYYSQFDGNNVIKNNRLFESVSNESLLKKNNNNYDYNKLESMNDNKFESNKEFLENYTSYVSAYYCFIFKK